MCIYVFVCARVCKSLVIFFFGKYHIHPVGLEPMISYSILCLQEEEVLFGPLLIGTNSLLLWIKIRLLLWSLVFYCCLLNHILCLFLTADGKCINVTGLQLPGVLDDLFSYNGPLGALYLEDSVSLYLWAPTAQVYHIF